MKRKLQSLKKNQTENDNDKKRKLQSLNEK